MLPICHGLLTAELTAAHAVDQARMSLVSNLYSDLSSEATVSFIRHDYGSGFLQSPCSCKDSYLRTIICRFQARPGCLLGHQSC